MIHSITTTTTTNTTTPTTTTTNTTTPTKHSQLLLIICTLLSSLVNIQSLSTASLSSLSSTQRQLSSFPSSCYDNTSFSSAIPATSDQITLQSIEASNPNDGYIVWMKETKGTYAHSEYIPTSSNECNGIAFHWTIVDDEHENNNDGGTIQIAVAVKFDYNNDNIVSSDNNFKGWMAIGFSETGGMRGADVVYFTFHSQPNDTNNSDSTTTVSTTLIDAHILDTLVKPTPDPVDDQNWVLVDYTISNTTNNGNDGYYVIFEAKRNLVSSDKTFDRSFVDDSSTFVQDHKLIGAWGINDMTYHGKNRIHTSIQLFQSNNSGGGSSSIDKALEPGLFYDQFQREMQTRSNGHIDMNIEKYDIPLQRTDYHEECHTPNLISDKEVYVIGYEFLIQPTSQKYLHHIVVYGHTQQNCGGGGGDFRARAPFIGWTPGDEFLYFPDNTGMKIGGGSTTSSTTAGFKSFTLQYHFDNSDFDQNKVDTGSGLRLFYTNEAVKDEIGMMSIGDPNIGLDGQSIGQGLTRHTFTCPSSCTNERFVTSDEITIVKEQLHMHAFGERMVNQVMRDGVVVHESSIDYWDFDQIGTASPQKKPFTVMKGDQFRSVCYYNSNDDTKFGFGSEDEMCMAFILYFPKQPLSTCSLASTDAKCATNYEGKYTLESVSELRRRFGNSVYSDMECTDSSTYAFGTYVYEGTTIVKDCDWLGESSPDHNLIRVKKWCDQVIEGFRVSDKCPRACLTCATPLVVQVPPNITIPSPSSTPTSIPNIFPSSEPSESLSDVPSNSPSNAPTHSVQPSFEPSSSPSKSAEPSSVPFASPSSKPSVTMSSRPSSSPSRHSSSSPSSSPSLHLSSSPSYTEQELELYITIEFDSLAEFDGKAKKIFENEIDTLIKLALNANGDEFSVFTRIDRFEKVRNSQSRRVLTRSNLHNRALQIPSGLRVMLNVFLYVRSGTRFTSTALSETILKALDDEEVRFDFIYGLQTSDSTNTFASINVMTKVSINDEEMDFSKNNGIMYLIYIAIGGGVGLIAAVLFAFILHQRRNRSSSSKMGGSRTQLSTPQNDPRISSTIEINEDSGEISTIGDPLGTGMFTGMQLIHHQQNTIMQQQQQQQQSIPPPQHYDYQRIYGGMGDSTQSLSTATEGQSSSHQYDNSDDYDDDEKIVVVAPQGSLGVVIGNPTGFPTVHAIKETSPIIDMIQIGDKLISVDGEDTTLMSAIRVSSLIGSKAMNPKRILVFARSLRR